MVSAHAGGSARKKQYCFRYDTCQTFLLRISPLSVIPLLS